MQGSARPSAEAVATSGIPSPAAGRAVSGRACRSASRPGRTHDCGSVVVHHVTARRGAHQVVRFLAGYVLGRPTSGPGATLWAGRVAFVQGHSPAVKVVAGEPFADTAIGHCLVSETRCSAEVSKASHVRAVGPFFAPPGEGIVARKRRDLALPDGGDRNRKLTRAPGAATGCCSAQSREGAP